MGSVLYNLTSALAALGVIILTIRASLTFFDGVSPYRRFGGSCFEDLRADACDRVQDAYANLRTLRVTFVLAALLSVGLVSTFPRAHAFSAELAFGFLVMGGGIPWFLAVQLNDSVVALIEIERMQREVGVEWEVAAELLARQWTDNPRVLKRIRTALKIRAATESRQAAIASRLDRLHRRIFLDGDRPWFDGWANLWTSER